MASDERYELRQFLSGYFHQDWIHEYRSSDPDQVVNAFIENERSEIVSKVVQQIDTILSENLPEDQLRLLLLDLGSYYDPTTVGATVGGWLRSVRERMTSGAQSRSS